jgi:hypothetical protein
MPPPMSTFLIFIFICIYYSREWGGATPFARGEFRQQWRFYFNASPTGEGHRRFWARQSDSFPGKAFVIRRKDNHDGRVGIGN